MEIATPVALRFDARDEECATTQAGNGAFAVGSAE
jgi:hypothetical protein